MMENDVSGTSRGSAAFTRANTCESVITSDYERWRLFERGERLFEPVRRAYEGAAAVVEYVADDLHLRQYEAALRGLYVLRRDEDDFRAGLV